MAQNLLSDMKRQPSLKGFPRPVQQQMEEGMPATSKQQFKFMKAVESGAVKKPGLSKSEAAEYTKGQSPKALPKRHRVTYPKPGGKKKR